MLLESKVQAGISPAQLRRHKRTATRYGYENAQVVLLSVDPSGKAVARTASAVLWKDVYTWFGKRQNKSVWAQRFVEYMEVFESKMVLQDYNIREDRIGTDH